MDELAELQALLGAVQKQETKYKLNERNCKELVLKLIEKGLVELIVTLDAKEYVTPAHLEKEILEEIIVHGGRVSLTEIQPTLNVDLRHIQGRFDEIMKADPSYRLQDGVVFTSEYLDGLAEEVNQMLQESGQLRLVELAANFNITTQFLVEALNPRLGSIVQGHCESGILFTSTYIERQTACIRGAFSAITRPTPVAAVQVLALELTRTCIMFPQSLLLLDFSQESKLEIGKETKRVRVSS
jgi:hypothetical protein